MSAGYYVGLLAVLFFNTWMWVSLSGIAALADCTPLAWLAGVMAAMSGIGLGAHIVRGFR